MIVAEGPVVEDRVAKGRVVEDRVAKGRVAEDRVAEDRLDAAFNALADPTRRAIVARLARGDATVNELAAPFDISLPGISKHLKVLEQSGLISRTRRAQFRPCHLEGEALDAAVSWIEENRRVWQERFDKLDEHLRELQRAPARRRRGRHP